ESPTQIDDERLLHAAESHRSHRLEQLGIDRTALATEPVPALRAELLRVLGELRIRHAGWRFGQMVEQMAILSQSSLYDVEDDQLLSVSQHLLDEGAAAR